MVPALFNLHIRLVPFLMPCSDPVSFTIFVLHCNLCDEKDASYPLYCCSSAAIFVFVVFWWMANKPQFQPKLPFLICLVWYRLRDLVQGGLAVDATRSAIADLVCMRTKLLRWSVFRPHFTSKVSFFPLGCFESPIALPRRQTRGSWVTLLKVFWPQGRKAKFWVAATGLVIFGQRNCQGCWSGPFWWKGLKGNARL